MTVATFQQVTFRIRDDDGNETGATWLANQGDDYSMDVDTKFRVRFRVDETTGTKTWSNNTFNLYYSHNSGEYAAVGAATPVSYTSTGGGPYYTDGDDCTSQLTGGTGTFLTDNNGMSSNDGAVTNSGSAGDLFECEFCLTIDSAQVGNGDSIELRVYNGTSAFGSGYTDWPNITVVEAAAANTDPLDIAHSHTIDWATITKESTVPVTEISHSHTIDWATATKESTVPVTEIAHTHTIDWASLSISVSTTVTEIAHTHLIDWSTTTKESTVPVVEVSHAHTIDPSSITQEQLLSVSDILHVNTIDWATTTKESTLPVIEILHSNTVDVVTVTTGAVPTASPDELLHAHTIDKVTISQAFNVDPADILHANAIDISTASVVYVVVPTELLHSNTLDMAVITQDQILTVTDILHNNKIERSTAFLPSVGGAATQSSRVAMFLKRRRNTFRN